MITNDYIKGYLAALRWTRDAAIAIQERLVHDEADLAITREHFYGGFDSLESLQDAISDNRQAYKELVDKLNKENSDAG